MMANHTKLQGLEPQPEQTPPTAGRAPVWVVGIAVLSMLAIKTGLLVADRVPFNADEAIVALMARHILAGARPIFFYGQAYMGSLDAYLVAGGFALFGEQVWVIRLVQMLLYAATLLTTARLGKAIFNSAWVGALAALLLAIPTVNVTLYTTASLGGYGEALLIGNLILLTSLSLRKRIEKGQSIAGLCLVWGFLAGLGLWVFGLTLIYSAPGGLYLLYCFWQALQARKMLWAGFIQAIPALLGGFLLGAAPWFVFASANGIEILVSELGGSAIAGVEQLPWLSRALQHLLHLVLLGLTAIFGLRAPWSAQLLAWPLLPFAIAFWMVALGFSITALRRRQPPVEERWLLTGIFLILGVVFIATPFGADPTGRYFVPLSVPLALFAAEMLVKIKARSRALMTGMLGVLLAFNLYGTVESALHYPPGITTQFHYLTQLDHRYDQALIDFLRAQGETTGYTNYWVSVPLAFQSQEELIFSPRLPYHPDMRYTPRDDRYPAYTRQVEAAERTAYITTHNPTLDSVLRQGFTRLGVTWQEEKIGDYQIYYALSRPIHPAELDLGKPNPP